MSVSATLAWSARATGSASSPSDRASSAPSAAMRSAWEWTAWSTSSAVSTSSGPGDMPNSVEGITVETAIPSSQTVATTARRTPSSRTAVRNALADAGEPS